MPLDVQQLLKDLELSSTKLAQQAEGMQDELLAAMRLREARIYSRMAEIVSDAPLTASRTVKLQWYMQNVEALGLRDEFKAGFMSDVQKLYLSKYQQLSENSLELLGIGVPGAPGGLTSVPQELVQFLRARDYAAFDFLNDEALKVLDDVLVDQLLTATSRSSMLSQLRGVITGSYKWGSRRGLYEWHAGTYARTAHMRFSRTVHAQQAQEYGVEWFIYVGPVDPSIRSFCLGRAGKAYTRQEIDRMDNGQTGSVFIDGGGWNCRHDWVGTTREVAMAVNEE